MGNDFKVDVCINIVPMVSGRTKYIAACGPHFVEVRDEETGELHNKPYPGIEDFDLESDSLKGVLIELRNKLDKLNVAYQDAYIVTEENTDEFSDEEKEVWATRIQDL